MLYEKLLFAVKYKVHPDDIKLLVNENPVIDTINDADKNALMIADIIVDVSNIEAAALKNAMRVIYWKNPGKEHQNKIVGLAWMNEKTISLFEGHILSPE